MKLSDRELATVLAALRYWQDEMAPYEDGSTSEHFQEVTPLTTKEIDDLCERLNTGESHE